jgi:lambda family phage tail tape measure protein
VYARAAASVKELQDRKANLARDEAGLIPVIDQQIAAIQARARADSEMIAASVQALQSQQLLEQDRVNNIERITAAIERQQTVADELNRIRKDGNQAIADATAEAAMAAMNPLERQREQIVRANEATARAAGAAFAAQFEGMELTARQAQELADGLDLIAEKYNKVTEIQLGNLEASRTWADGWRSAFDDYVDAATNAASQARSVFSVATKGMEDMFVNFARTGKLNVKDLFKTIVETILRSQVQQLLARTLSGGGGGGGSILGTLFGAITGARSAGGPVSAGRAYRVGESGPETFVPTGGGSIVPGGGATSVTYNITATDAASFQALIARDPEFLFAVTEQGRKRMPNNRR